MKMKFEVEIDWSEEELAHLRTVRPCGDGDDWPDYEWLNRIVGIIWECDISEKLTAEVAEFWLEHSRPPLEQLAKEAE